jgi:electron transfer flavoprotein alpha subunit
MTEVLVVASHYRGAIRPATLESVTAGASHGRVTVAVLAADPSSYVDQLLLEGVAEVVGVPTPSDDFDSDVYRAALGEIAAEKDPDLVLDGFTVDAMGYAPALAIASERPLVTDVQRVDVGPDGALTAWRTFYNGKVEAEIEASRGAVVLLRPGVHSPAVPGSAPTYTQRDITLPVSRIRHQSYVEPDLGDDLDITKEPFLLAIGRGVGSAENIELFKELADKLGATLVASRPLVDAGWIPSSRQVGQSGRTVKPDLYLAFGVSGAIQHLAGMKESETIVAVNTDPEAAIFNVAHYGAVADIFDVAEELAKHF